MANTIKIRRSTTASSVPTTTQLDQGELAVNVYDGKLFFKKVQSGVESIVTLQETAASGITSLNSQTGATQTFAIGSGNSSGQPYWASASNTHTLHLPTATNAIRGLVSNATQTFGGRKDLLDGCTVGDTGVSGGRLSVYHGGATVGIYSKQTSASPTANYFSFVNSSNSAVCALNSSGNLLVNRTTNPVFNTERVAVGASTGQNYITVSGGSTANGDGAALMARIADTTVVAIGNYSAAYSGGAYSAVPTIYFNAQPKVIGIGAGAGTNAMRYDTTNYQWTYDTSSLRYKDNVRDSVYGLDAVLAMKSRQFAYKDSGREDVGFIAEEMVEVVPEVVSRNADNLPDGVSYDRLVSVLCKAVQELSQQVDSLKSRIAVLEAA
jgi:hypothetical protein